MGFKKLLGLADDVGVIGHTLKSGMPAPERRKTANGSIAIALVVFALIVGYLVSHL